MKRKVALFAFVLLSAAAAMAEPPADEGKTIFTTRCASCHNVNKVLTGPALSGLDQRRTIEWIVQFVKSSQTLVKKGDTAAVALFEKFNRIPMPDHPDLTEAHIRSIVDYIKSESSTAATEKAPFARPHKLRPAYVPLSGSDYGFFAGFLAVVAVLVAVLIFAVHVKSFERATEGWTE